MRGRGRVGVRVGVGVRAGGRVGVGAGGRVGVGAWGRVRLCGVLTERFMRKVE